MLYDIFFDCPQCNHTIKVSSDLVGDSVDCPDCDNAIQVPDIRDGINPRLKSQTEAKASPPTRRLADLEKDIEHLGAGLHSILRRQAEQIKQTDFLEGNCNLLYKQLTLLDLNSPTTNGIPLKPAFQNTIAPATTRNWIKWSVAFSLASLCVAIVLFVMFLQAT
jgi:hypothetical protein